MDNIQKAADREFAGFMALQAPDIPLSNALLLWNPGSNGDAPAFAVRPLGHPDYYVFGCQNGACMRRWHDLDDMGRKFRLMIELWHIVAFYDVPVKMVFEAMLVVPEYRDMLASDCLPQQFRFDRD